MVGEGRGGGGGGVVGGVLVFVAFVVVLGCSHGHHVHGGGWRV